MFAMLRDKPFFAERVIGDWDIQLNSLHLQHNHICAVLFHWLSSVFMFLLAEKE